MIFAQKAAMACVYSIAGLATLAVMTIAAGLFGFDISAAFFAFATLFIGCVLALLIVMPFSGLTLYGPENPSTGD